MSATHLHKVAVRHPHIQLYWAKYRVLHMSRKLDCAVSAFIIQMQLMYSMQYACPARRVAG